MDIAGQLHQIGLPFDALVLGGLLLLILGTAVNLAVLLRRTRGLERRVRAHAEEIAALREDALYRAPAKAAVAAMMVADHERTQNLAAIERQLSQLLDEWAHVESLSEEAYAILKELRERNPSQAA